jgi:hypothetical protein
MTEIFLSLPQGAKDYLIWAIIMAIGIIFYYIGQMGLAMLVFSIGIVLYMLFSFSDTFHIFRNSDDDDADNHNDDFSDIDDDRADDENDGGNDADIENNDDKE